MSIKSRLPAKLSPAEVIRHQVWMIRQTLSAIEAALARQEGGESDCTCDECVDPAPYLKNVDSPGELPEWLNAAYNGAPLRVSTVDMFGGEELETEYQGLVEARVAGAWGLW